MFTKRTILSAVAAIGLLAALPAAAAQYTYVYTGPNFTGPYTPASAGHVSISITLPALLTPNTTYSGLPAGATNATITVAGATGPGAFSLPVHNFAVSTDANGNIASWFVMSDANTLTGTFPQTGTDQQVYTMNTLSTAVPIPGGVTGHYAYDQATVTVFYASCAGVTGCTLAGNGQPYVTTYAGIVNPAAGTWTLSGKGGGGSGGGGKGGKGGKDDGGGNK